MSKLYVRIRTKESRSSDELDTFEIREIGTTVLSTVSSYLAIQSMAIKRTLRQDDDFC